MGSNSSCMFLVIVMEKRKNGRGKGQSGFINVQKSLIDTSLYSRIM